MTLFDCLFSTSLTIYFFSETLVSSKPLARGVLWLGQLSISHSNKLTNLRPFLVLKSKIIYLSELCFFFNGVEISGSLVSWTK